MVSFYGIVGETWGARALLAGITDPTVLAELARGRLRSKNWANLDRIVEANAP
jgi:hypothetical protein